MKINSLDKKLTRVSQEREFNFNCQRGYIFGG